jgi:hypothetical protein
MGGARRLEGSVTGRPARSRRRAVVSVASCALLAASGCEGALRGEDPNAIHVHAVPDAAPPEPEEPDLPASAALNAAEVVAALRPAFRDCYEAALRRDPRIEGFTTLEVRLDPTGHVTSSAASGTFGLDPRTADCMASVIRPAVFDPPGPSGAKLNVPLRFRPDAPPPPPPPGADAGTRRFP